jgi:transcriptional regulator with PAS, ATPase and Fis domain
LRERREDIKPLALQFLAEFCEENHKAITSISPEVMDVFRKYDWPGNVRELKNVIERAVLLETSDTITTRYLPERMLIPPDEETAESAEDLRTLEEMSKAHIKEVLQKTDGNKTQAAEILGINRTSLWRMMRRLKLEQE